MREFICIILIAVVISFLIWCSFEIQVKEEKQIRDTFTSVQRIESCTLNKGPYWGAGKNERVYYITFDNGKHAYVHFSTFGAKLEFTIKD